jgi:hypothetical protein
MFMGSKGAAAQRSARGDTHGYSVRVIGGQCVGEVSGALPTQLRRGVSRLVAHVAARMCQP